MNKLFIKGSLIIISALMLASFFGCSGNNKKQFAVPKENLPKGVVQYTTPLPNKETIIVEILTTEALFRKAVALGYTRALMRYDVKKGNIKELKALVEKNKKAWKLARDTASIASYYATELHKLSRQAGYNPYSTIALQRADTNFLGMRMAYAKDQNATREEIYAKDSKEDIQKMVEEYTEQKRLLGMTKLLHTDAKTAYSVMQDIYPERNGRNFEEIATDIAYKGAYVAKSAGKVAGVGIAILTVPVTATAGTMLLTVAAGTACLVDTGLDVVQTAVVVFKGEEDAALSKVQKVTGTVSTTLGLTGLLKSGYNQQETIKVLEGLNVSNKNLQAAANSLDGINYGGTAIGYMNGGLSDAGEVGEMIATTAFNDGKRTTRAGIIDMSKLDSLEEKAKLEALGSSVDRAQEISNRQQLIDANAATADAKQLMAGESEITGKTVDNNEIEKQITAIRTDIAKNVLGLQNVEQLDNAVIKLSEEEKKQVAVSLETKKSGNNANSGLKNKNTVLNPYALEIVAGTYKIKEDAKEQLKIIFEVKGNKLKAQVIGKDPKTGKWRIGSFVTVPNYNPQTGIGGNEKLKVVFRKVNGKMTATLTYIETGEAFHGEIS